MISLTRVPSGVATMSDLFLWSFFWVTFCGTSVPFTGQEKNDWSREDARHFVFWSHHLVFRKPEKDNGMASGHSTSIASNRDFKSGRLHILFGYFSFIMLNLWLPQHPSFGNDSWYIAHSLKHMIITESKENYLQGFPSKYIWKRKNVKI